MRPAPPVRVLGGSVRAWRVTQAALLGIAAAGLTAWGAQWLVWALDLVVPDWAVGLLAVGPGGLMAWMSWRRSPLRATLAWDGKAWHVAAPPQAGLPHACHPRVALDAQGWMLINCEGAPAALRWLALQQQDNPAVWTHWRAAVYSGAPSERRAASGRPGQEPA